MKKSSSKVVPLSFARANFNPVVSLRQAAALLLSAAIAISPSLTVAAEKPSDAASAKKKTPGGSSKVLFTTPAGNNSGNTGKDNGCHLGSRFNPIKHVIYIQFDNVHFERDNPNVPSDLEQMPHLLNFLKDNGALLTNSHTPLISHTSVDILTSLTGVYGDRHGSPIGNAFGYYPLPGTSTAADLFDSTFTYWTDPVNSASLSADPLPIMLAQTGKNAPAPWAAYTRAGCNFGAVSIANMEFEKVAVRVERTATSGPVTEIIKQRGARASRVSCVVAGSVWR
jgi:hypothetical protein